VLRLRARLIARGSPRVRARLRARGGSHGSPRVTARVIAKPCWVCLAAQRSAAVSRMAQLWQSASCRWLRYGSAVAVSGLQVAQLCRAAGMLHRVVRG
jgi:hypothetical protein